MTYWNSKGMSQCRSALQESEKRIRKIADKYMAELDSGKPDPGKKKILAELLETLFAIAGLESSIVEGIPAIDRIYTKNEQRIADYFDLVVQRVPRTKIGISTMESLREHEEQMPFERRKV